MDLRPVGDERGSVIFGGIDTKKFTGPLHKLPIVPASQSPDKYTRYVPETRHHSLLKRL